MAISFNANETIKRAEEEYGLGSGQYFKIQEGPNRIRLLSPAVGHQSEYQGKPSFKFVAWIIDRKDGKVKLYFMPATILNAIGALQLSEDYAFDTVPMPYDITINAKNAGKKEVEYQVVAARNNTPVSADEMMEFEGKPGIDEVIAKLKDKQGTEEAKPQTGYEKAKSVAESLPQPPEPEINVEEIPF